MKINQKLNRAKYYKDLTFGTNIEKDLLTQKFNSFKWSDSFIEYRLNDTDVLRPELMAYKFYNNIHYWWVILKLNNIDDVWNDLHVNTLIKIPSINDVERLFKHLKIK